MLHLIGLVIDCPRPPGHRRHGVDVHLRAVEPASGQVRVESAPEIDTAVARRFAIRLELEGQAKIRILPVGHQPDVVVVLAAHRVAQDGAVLHRPEHLATVFRPAFDVPSGQVPAVEQRHAARFLLRLLEGVCRHAGHPAGITHVEGLPLHGQDLRIREGNILAIAQHGAAPGRHPAALDADVPHRHLGQAREAHRARRTVAHHIPYVDVAELGCRLVHRENLLRRTGLVHIVEAEGYGVRDDVLHIQVVDPDLLDHATAAAGAFEAQADIRADETAVRHPDVADAAAHFAADREAAVPVIDDAVVNQHILAWHAPVAAGFVLAGLDADGVIPAVD